MQHLSIYLMVSDDADEDGDSPDVSVMVDFPMQSVDPDQMAALARNLGRVVADHIRSSYDDAEITVCT